MVFEKSKRMRKSENVREKVGYRDTNASYNFNGGSLRLYIHKRGVN